MSSIILMGFTVIMLAFFAALFERDKRKRSTAFIFTGIVYVSLVVLFINDKMFHMTIGMPVMAIMIALMLLNGNRAVSIIAWIVTFVYVIGWVVSIIKFDFANIFDFDLHGLGANYRQYGIDTWKGFVGFCGYGLYLMHFPLMITATIVRYKRRKSGYFDKPISLSITLNNNTYSTFRVNKNNWALVGNLLSLLSYVGIIMAVRYLIITLSPIVVYEQKGQMVLNTIEIIRYNYSTQVIVYSIIGIICGGAGWLLLRYAKSYGYESGALGKAAYIWSWVPVVIIIALIIITMLIICAATNVEFSSVANKRVYKVIDENGEVRTLDYSAKDLYAKCKDDKGEWWETSDGGSTFSKCDLYKIKDDIDHDKFIRDVSGGGKRIFTDGQGGTYESTDGGMTVTEQKD